jgi:hypothetical protein
VIHDHIVWLGKRVGDDLKWETNADFEGVRAGLGEKAVVKSPTTTQPVASAIESEARADEGVDFAERDFRRTLHRLKDAKGSGVERVPGMESEVVASHFRIDPPQMGMLLADRREIHLSGKC